MALKATVCKAELAVSDFTRDYYETHSLTLAQHPSETDERLMVRVLVFALHAGPALELGRGLSSDEPDLWRKDLTGQIELWIEIGQPDEQSLRRVCGRAQQVFVYTYSGNSAEAWWSKIGESLRSRSNLSVIDIAPASTKALATLAQRAMQLQCFIQDGEVQMLSDARTVPVALTPRLTAQPSR